MWEKHHLMRHEHKAQTWLRRHTLWTTAVLWPEQVGGQGRGDGWVNYSIGGRRLGSGLMTTKHGVAQSRTRLKRLSSSSSSSKQTTGWDRKSKPMMKADTLSENSNSKENIQNCSFTNTRQEIKQETTEKSSKNFKYQLISQWCKL